MPYLALKNKQPLKSCGYRAYAKIYKKELNCFLRRVFLKSDTLFCFAKNSKLCNASLRSRKRTTNPTIVAVRLMLTESRLHVRLTIYNLF